MLHPAELVPLSPVNTLMVQNGLLLLHPELVLQNYLQLANEKLSLIFSVKTFHSYLYLWM